MIIPKFIRKWKYNKILEKLKNQNTTYDKPIYLCLECKYRFPYINIKHYPELWNRKETTPWFPYTQPDRNPEHKVWFKSNKERQQYLIEALNILKQK